MIEFWIGILAISNVIGMLIALYQIIMQTYYTKKGEKERKEIKTRDDAIAERFFSIETQLTNYVNMSAMLMTKVQNVEKQLKEKKDDTNTIH